MLRAILVLMTWSAAASVVAEQEVKEPTKQERPMRHFVIYANDDDTERPGARTARGERLAVELGDPVTVAVSTPGEM